MIKVQIKPGLYIQLTEEEARTRGLLPVKMREPVVNKAIKPAKNKGQGSRGKGQEDEGR